MIRELLASASLFIIQFFFFSFIGWLIRTTITSVKRGSFFSSGFLLGPLLPEYGLYAVLVYALTGGTCRTPLQYLTTFIASAILYSLLKYATDHYTESVLHVKWNSHIYATEKLDQLMFWGERVGYGLLGIVFIKWINPFVLRLIYWMPDAWVTIGSVVLMLLLFVDILFSNLIIRNGSKLFFFTSCLAILALVVTGCYGYYITGYRSSHERNTVATSTNTDEVYAKKDLEKALSSYDMLSNMDVEEQGRSYVIPGLKETETILIGKWSRPSMCTSMTPQGLAVAGRYLFISAYCATHLHHSVIYMIDRYTGQYVKEIVLDGRPHAGGLAYDEKHQILWVSGYQANTAYVNALRMKDIEEYELQDKYEPITYSAKYPLEAIERNSYMTYADGSLYIGHYDDKSETVVERYPVEPNGLLRFNWKTREGKEYISPLYSATITTRTQGFALSNDNVLLSKSYGILPSSLLVFDNQSADNRKISFVEDGAAYAGTLPPGMEQICVSGGKVFILFESAAYAYRALPQQHVDRVLVVDLADLIPQEEEMEEVP